MYPPTNDSRIRSASDGSTRLVEYPGDLNTTLDATTSPKISHRLAAPPPAGLKCSLWVHCCANVVWLNRTCIVSRPEMMSTRLPVDCEIDSRPSGNGTRSPSSSSTSIRSTTNCSKHTDCDSRVRNSSTPL